MSFMQSAELIGTKFCPFVERTLITLNFKKIPHKVTFINFFDRPNWFSEISPHNKVPVLKHGNDICCESSAINQYLDEVFKEPNLMSKVPAERCSERVWTHWINTVFAPDIYRFLCNKDESKTSLYHNKLQSDLDFIENGLSGKFQSLKPPNLPDGPFIHGDRFGYADVSIAPFIMRLEVAYVIKGFDYHSKSHKKFQNLINALTQHPASKDYLSDNEIFKAYDKFLEKYCNQEGISEFGIKF